MAYSKPSGSEGISAPCQVAANLSQERLSFLSSHWPFPAQRWRPQKDPLNQPGHSPWQLPGIHVTIAGEEMWLIMVAFPSHIGQWSQLDVAAQPLPVSGGKGVSGRGYLPQRELL